MSRNLACAVLWLVILAGQAWAQATTQTQLLRAGDVVALSLPGEPALTGNFQIDQDGNINLAEIGPVLVAGLTVDAALAEIGRRLQVAFRDIDRLRLRLVERRLPVKVLGTVRQPGQVEVPERSSVQVAIQAAGGVAEGADLQRLQLRRGERVITFDYQRYLDTGSPGLLPALEPLDTLFVPRADRQVQVMGAVRNPGIFPWSDGLSLLEALAQAGGPTPQADLSRLQILAPSQGRDTPKTFDLAAFLTRGGDLRALPRPAPGATVIVPELAPGAEYLRAPADGSVYVLGAVGKPGRYAYGPSLRLLDLLAVANGPTQDADIENVVVTRKGPKGPEATPLNLRQFFDTGDASLLPELRVDDIVYVPGRNRSWLDESKESTVRVLGAVARPGRYRFDDSMTILDLLAEAGGPTGDALQRRIVVVNLSCCRDQARTFDLEHFARTGDFASLPVVRPGDTVYVPYLSQSNYAIFMGGVRDIFQILSTVLIVATLGGGL